MSLKIYTSNNYFYIEDTVSTTLYEGFSREVLIRRKNPTDEEFSVTGLNNWDRSKIIQFTDVDLTGAPYTDFATFVTWYEENTGNSGAGETAALKTGAYLIGWQDFADTATTLTPIEQTNIAGGEVKLTNNNQDTLTDGTTTNNAETTPIGVNDLWNNQNNTLIFDGTGIKKNDIIFIRIHLKVNAKIVEQSFDVRLDFYDQPSAQGTKVFSLRKQIHIETLSAGVFREEMVTHDFFVGESILNGSAEIILEGTKNFEVEVIGWNLKIFRIAR